MNSTQADYSVSHEDPVNEEKLLIFPTADLHCQSTTSSHRTARRSRRARYNAPSELRSVNLLRPLTLEWSKSRIARDPFLIVLYSARPQPPLTVKSNKKRRPRGSSLAVLQCQSTTLWRFKVKKINSSSRSLPCCNPLCQTTTSSHWKSDKKKESER